MITAYTVQTATICSEANSPWDSRYGTPVCNYIHLGRIFQTHNVSDTASVLNLSPPEQDLNAYQCARSSGVLAFWDRPEENIYNPDDGEAA